MADHITNQLAAALREAVAALNLKPRFTVYVSDTGNVLHPRKTHSYDIASKCNEALKVYDQWRQEVMQVEDLFQIKPTSERKTDR